MYYGASYYPEHKSEEDLKHDLKLLKESGINTVRMGEFSWCRMEQKPGVYSFGWLERVVNELGNAGIKTVICTPTACPPAHLISAHPDILYMDNRGVRRPFGGRRHYCYNNEDYREACARVTEELAKVFGRNPYVLGFQIDNEPAQEGTGRCHCPVCVQKFQSWLEKKYGSVENLNRHWGTIFWSMEYDSFSQILPPVNTIEQSADQAIRAYHENPGLRLDFERFCSESQIEFQNIQTEILHRYSDAPVTTNGTGLATNSINYYESYRDLDVYAFDFYPNLRNGEIDPFPYAFARGIRQGQKFWVLEFVSGGGHKLNGNGRMQPNPGALKQATLHAFAQGAEMLLHFQFRSFPFGAEQLNYAILDLDGKPRRRYDEMKETAALLRRLEPLENTRIHNRVALCFDYDSLWALKIKPVNDPYFQYTKYQSRLFSLLEKAGYGADVISLDGDFDEYPVLIIPTAFLMSRETQKKVRDYVAQGGVAVATFLTSVKDEYNTGYTDSLPAGLTEVFGVTVEEVEPVFEGQNRLALTWSDAGSTGDDELGIEGKAAGMDGLWSEILDGEAAAQAVYAEDFKAGKMVISKHAYGQGTAYYMGTDLEDEPLGGFLTGVLKEAGIEALPFELPERVQAFCRENGEERYYFLFNFALGEAAVRLQGTMKDYLTGEHYKGEILLERNGYAILSPEL